MIFSPGLSSGILNTKTFLSFWKINKLSPLLKRSLETAELDGRARNQKKSLLENLKRRNHYFMNTLTVDELIRAQNQNFRRFKVKVCQHPELELSQLECLQKLLTKQNLLRLDCNGRGDEEFFKNLEPVRDKIEFIEDPFSNSKRWHSSWPFAYDQPGFDFEKVQTSWQVIKPNKQSREDMKGKKLVYTSSMGILWDWPMDFFLPVIKVLNIMMMDLCPINLSK